MKPAPATTSTATMHPSVMPSRLRFSIGRLAAGCDVPSRFVSSDLLIAYFLSNAVGAYAMPRTLRTAIRPNAQHSPRLPPPLYMSHHTLPNSPAL